MSGEKKDLTRIEDLSEYLHDLDQADEAVEDPFDSTGLPDLPSEGEGSTFNSTTEETSPFEDSPFEESPFEDSPFEDKPTETPAFETTEPIDFNSNNEDEFAVTESPAEKTELPPIEDEVFTLEEPVMEAPAPEPEPQSSFKSPEDFEDLKKFAESSSFSGMSAEGNPSFSVLVKNIRFVEDVQDILILLKELGLLSDSEEQTRSRLMRGNLLVPRISEYAAISLAHKLRRFDIDIQVGLSDEIHPPKHKESPETGLVSKHSLYQNQTHHFHFDDPKLEISQIIVAATSSLEGHQVIRYIGVASEHKIIEGHIVENENSEEIPRYYTELAKKLRAHALKAHANAVVGLNYQLTPIPSDLGLSGHKYRLSCTGNLVWVNKL